jgi:hypothetical protein
MAVDAAGNLFIADTNNHRMREVFASNSIIQTIIGNGTGGFAGDLLPGRGVTITASIATGGLSVTAGVDVEQSTWQFSGPSTPTSGPGLNFTVQQTAPCYNCTGMRMNQNTTFSLINTVANVVSLPLTLTIPNNATSVSPTLSISSISRSGNLVTLTTTGPLPGINANQIVAVSGVTDASFNGVFTLSDYNPNANRMFYTQAGPNASSSGGSVATAVTIGAISTGGALNEQIEAQASGTGIALGASLNLSITPLFTSVTPISGTRGGATPAPIPVTIKGQNLLTTTGITAPSGITVSGITVSLDGTTMTASISLPSTAPTGLQNFTINIPNGPLNFSFTVN